MADDKELQFDEDEAVKFIRNYMPENIRNLYSDDEILNIIDMIWDYYEQNGMLEISSEGYSDDTEPELPKILDYVNKMLKKDKLAVVDTDDVHFIVEGELEYEKSIGVEDA